MSLGWWLADRFAALHNTHSRPLRPEVKGVGKENVALRHTPALSCPNPCAIKELRLAQLDPLFLVIAHRPRVEGNRGCPGRLVRELEERRVLVHPHELLLLLEERLRDRVDE